MVTETVSSVMLAVTSAMTDVIGISVIAVVAVAAVALSMAWSGLRRVLRVGGR